MPEAGEVSVNGVDEKSQPLQPVMHAGDVDTFQGVLQFLDRVMTPDGVLFFHSCLAGSGP